MLVSLHQWVRQAAHRLAENGIESANLEARVLAAHILGVEPAKVPLLADRALNRREQKCMDTLLDRRLRREPIQYLTGEAHFWTLNLKVSPHVLIPRPETEHLVEVVLEFLYSHHVVTTRSDPQIGLLTRELLGADLGTGSGAIALSLLSEVEDLCVYAVDNSSEALSVAKANAARLGLNDRICFLCGSWGAPLIQLGLTNSLDFLASNPPYISEAELSHLEPDVRCYEPLGALVGGVAGWEPYQYIVEYAATLLKPEGLLALEVSPMGAPSVAAVVEKSGAFGPPQIHRDYAGRVRVITANRLPN